MWMRYGHLNGPSQNTVNTAASVNHVSKPIHLFNNNNNWSVRITLSELCKLVRVRRIWGVYDVCEGSSGVWWMTLYPHTLHSVVNELQAPFVVLEVQAYVISGHMHPCPRRSYSFIQDMTLWKYIMHQTKTR